ncbi:MAG: hypothetical protein JW940_10675 [Polyangiaceae bacterium]|nr:hypothetical protein [Polyangiaceae bacterium]
MHSLGRTKWWVALLCWGVACGERSADVHDSAEVMASAVVGDEMVFVRRDDSRGYWLALGGNSPKARVTERDLPREPLLTEQRRNSQELLLLCRRPANVEDGPEGVLVVLGAHGIDRSYKLGTGYNRLMQSEDGRYVFLSSIADSGSDTGYTNASDVSIVDLEAAQGSSNPMQRNLSNGAEALSAVFVSPEMRIGDEGRRLATVLFQSSLSILDLKHPDRREWTAKLASGGGESNSVGLRQAVFSPDTLRIYLRGAASSDVYLLQLRARTAPEAHGNDFDFSLNQLGVGEYTTDMELLRTQEGERLLATTVGPGLLVVNADSSTVTRVSLGRPATMIVPFATGDEAQHTLLLGEGEPVAAFVDLANLETRKDRNVEALTLPGSVASVTRLNGNRLLVTYQGTGLSVVDLESRTISSITSNSPLPSGATLVDSKRDRVWLVVRGESRVGFFDLDGMQPREVRLDATIASAGLVGGSKATKLAVLHPGLLGHVTLLDAQTPSRKTAQSLRGFMFDGILDRGED